MAKADSLEGDRLDVLVTLVADYERKHYPIDFPDPAESLLSNCPPPLTEIYSGKIN